jgi:lysophospholipase L1-like esterase
MTSPIPRLSELPMTFAGLHRYHEKYNEIVREVAESKGVGLVDLAREFDSHDQLWDSVSHDWIHFNARGHLLAAQLIAQYMMDSGGR